MRLLCWILGLILFKINRAESKNNVYCYHGTWSYYRPDKGKFSVADHLDPDLCTHIAYTFFGLSEMGKIKILDPWLDIDLGNIKKFNELKKKNSNLKTLAAVGGWNEGSGVFSRVARDPIKRSSFIQDAVNFCLQYEFDGLDFDWEYPGQREGSIPEDKENYSQFLKELADGLHSKGLLLTAAVAAVEYSAKTSYDIPEISKHLDIINVMAYDLHGSWDAKTGINAPLYAGPADVTDKERQLNVNASIWYWINQGAVKEKLLLGIPFYGRTFTLQNAQNNGIGAEHVGPGIAGPYTREPGHLGYNEICENKLQWSEQWEETQQVPYAVNGNQWVGYENSLSIALKVKFARDLGLGGVMVWPMETDDFRGTCGEGRYPLLGKIHGVLNGGENPTAPSTEIESTTTPLSSISVDESSSTLSSTQGTQSSTVDESSSTLSSTQGTQSSTASSMITTKPTSNSPSTTTEFICTENGSFGDPYDCTVYYMCHNGFKYKYKCPAGLYFDEKAQICNWPNEVDCTM